MRFTLSILIVLVATLFSGVSRGQDFYHRHSIGIRPTINQVNLRYNFEVNPRWGLHAEVGCQGRYRTTYHQKGELPRIIPPILASYGYQGEMGAHFFVVKRIVALSVNATYKQTSIDKITSWKNLGDGYSERRGYARYDQRFGLKGLLECNIKGWVRAYGGLGVAYTLSTERNVVHYGPSQPSIDDTDGSFELTKPLIRPTIHLGVVFFPVRFGKNPVVSESMAPTEFH